MARKTTISKEIILDSALKMLIRDGYSSIKAFEKDHTGEKT